MGNHNKFMGLVLTLGSRVRRLQLDARRLRADVLEDQIGKCEAFLAELKDRAEKQAINLMEFYGPFMHIQGTLEHLTSVLEERSQPWWKKCLIRVARLLNFVASIVGLPPLLPEGTRVGGLLCHDDV